MSTLSAISRCDFAYGINNRSELFCNVLSVQQHRQESFDQQLEWPLNVFLLGLSSLTALTLSLTRRGEGYSHIVWVGVCRWVRESPTVY